MLLEYFLKCLLCGIDKLGRHLIAGCVLGAALILTAGPPAASEIVATTETSRALGKRLFLRCASCHAITEGGTAKIGPNLLAVVGRKAGGLPGYSYSAAMKAQSFIWDEATLDRWLTRPNEVVPGTAMAFSGLPKAEDRQALIAFLTNPTQ